MSVKQSPSKYTPLPLSTRQMNTFPSSSSPSHSYFPSKIPVAIHSKRPRRFHTFHSDDPIRFSRWPSRPHIKTIFPEYELAEMSTLEVRPSATLDLGTERPTSPDSTHGAVVEIGTESEEKWSAVSISSDRDAEKENVPPGRLATAKMGSIEKRQKARKGDGVGKTRQFFRTVQNAIQKTSKRDWKM